MVQKEVVNTLIKKGPQCCVCVFFFKEIKMLMVTFFPFFPPLAVSVSLEYISISALIC